MVMDELEVEEELARKLLLKHKSVRKILDEYNQK